MYYILCKWFVFSNFPPLGYDEICRHLIGNNENGCDVVGIYTIIPDNNCAFLCTDFDDKSCKHGYKDDVLAFVGVCRDWNISYSIERSRSGNGAHVWIFFDDVVPAYKTRRLGNTILTEAMSRDGRINQLSESAQKKEEKYLVVKSIKKGITNVLLNNEACQQ